MKFEIKTKNKLKTLTGFTLIEIIVSLAIFTILATAFLGVYSILSRSVKLSREKTIISSMASNYMEVLRNLPYSQVGTIVGNPTGQLPDFTNAIVQKIESVTYKIYYEVTYIDDPADGIFPTDVAANDYKQVKMTILNTTSNQTNSFVTNVSPKGLEGTSNAGALWVKVFNSQGQPVSGANVHIEYPTTSPFSIVLDRSTNAAGEVIEVNLPIATNQYRIVVSKAGYSTDRTYHYSVTTPSPVKPDATIVNGSITQVSFSIDLLSNLTIRTLNETCQPINGVALNVMGAKKIATSPDVVKYSQNFTSAAGTVSLANIEWDSYTPTLLTGGSYIVKGTSPIQKIDVLPGTSQTFTLNLVTNSTANSLLMIVKDVGTGAPLEGATVNIEKGPFSASGVTGGSVWLQNNWSGGGGMTDYNPSQPTRYFEDDGNIDVTTAPPAIRLKKVGGVYQSSGWLTSGSFDTGTNATNYTTLTWEPISQSASTTVAFQLAANNDNATWNFVGPDGTSATYYTTPGTNITSSFDNNRYYRYKVFLTTADGAYTPVVSTISTNFVTGCYTPGQVLFKDLDSGLYEIDVSMPGYQNTPVDPINVNGNQSFEVLLSPS